MKKELILIGLVVVAAISLFNLQSSMEPHDKLMFQIWKEKNNKVYEEQENLYRFGVWLNNFDYVKKHNARFDAGLQSFDLQMNLFADLTNQEFAAKHLGLDKSIKATKNCTGKQAPTDKIPDTWDWQSKGAVTPIKNQGQCGSCWAFSTTGSLEGAHFRSTSTLTSFSQQQLVDCSTAYGNKGCNGGLMDQAFWYVKDIGITTEAKYPYRGIGGSCKYTDADKAWTISDCSDVTADKQLPLVAAVYQQPVSVAIEANHISFQLYKSGVYSGLCGTNLDHGVLAVGFGTQDSKKYYKVKNSWGAGWGAKGYILIERNGDGKGKCGIQMVSSFPIA